MFRSSYRNGFDFIIIMVSNNQPNPKTKKMNTTLFQIVKFEEKKLLIDVNKHWS